MAVDQKLAFITVYIAYDEELFEHQVQAGFNKCSDRIIQYCM